MSFQTTKRRLVVFAGLAIFCMAIVGIQMISAVGGMILGDQPDQVAMIPATEHESILSAQDALRTEQILQLEGMLATERGENEALHQASDELANEFAQAVNSFTVQISRLAEMSAIPLPDLDLPAVTAMGESATTPGRGGPWNGFRSDVVLPRGLNQAENHLASLLDIADGLTGINEIMADRQDNLACTPMVMPFTESFRITDDFGSRRHPITREWDFHNGTDIAAPYGTPILAPADGVVTFAGRRAGYGRMVDLNHDDGLLFDDEGDPRTVDFKTRYAHLSRITVDDGERVQRGDQIGLVGSSGMATGAHLHYEVHADGDPIDPVSLVHR